MNARPIMTRGIGALATGLLAIAAAPAGLAAQQAEQAGQAAAAGLTATPPAAGAALIAEAPVFPPVQPPSAYQRAVEAGTRSADGTPGPNYWQQRVDYSIDVRLDPATALVTGSETVTIHNASPEPLPALAVHLYQNVFSEGVERNRTVELTGGMTLSRVAMGGTELRELTPDEARPDSAVGYLPIDTRMIIRPPAPIAPGASAEVVMDWSFTVSGGGGFRTGHLDNEIFTIAQWYPQITVNDDVFGVDFTPYLGDGEFYVDYGSFDVAIDVPAGWVVVGTGELVNPEEVLHEDQVELLASAAELDTVAYVVSAEDVVAGPESVTRTSESGRLTWRFHAENVRDFAWATSNRYAWNVTGAATGHEDGRALIQGVFPPEATTWAQAAPIAKAAIEFYSEQMIPYPYPHATVAYGPPQVGGMEYPMITFINHRDEPMSLNATTTHELSHFWVPMIVGTKESAYAWMDEGLTTFNTALALRDYYGDDTPERRTRSGAMRGYLRAAEADVEVPIMRNTDYADNGFGRSIAAYSKPGMLLHTLRHMMGEEAFDAAYRNYIETWSYKHPMPWDFFRMMEGAAGVGLDWFWQAWFYDTVTLDQAIEAVEPAEDGVAVTVSNNDGGVMPVELHVELADGTVVTDVWPVNAWEGTREVTRVVPVEGDVAGVRIDPEAWYPDIDRTNNDWEAPGG